MMNFKWLKLFLLTLCVSGALQITRAHADDLDDAFEPSQDREQTNIIKMLQEDPSRVKTADPKNHYTALHVAAEHAHIAVVKWLLKHKADVDAASIDGYTPLYITKNGEVATLLIKGGANLNHRDNWGKTPLQHAALAHHQEVCDAILNSGFRLDLTSALILKKNEEAKKIIKKKPAEVKPSQPDIDLWGNTSPLGIAAGNGDAEIVRLLLKAGAPVNAVTDCPNGPPMTPLCNAVWGGHFEAAELLCNAGADCNVTGGKGYPNLLDFAQEHSDAAMVDLLIKHGGKFGVK